MFRNPGYATPAPHDRNPGYATPAPHDSVPRAYMTMDRYDHLFKLHE
jgi:hypothetical protein